MVAKKRKLSFLQRSPKWSKILLISAVVLIVALVSASYLVRRTYHMNLRAFSSDQTTHHVTVALGSSVGVIADLLKEKNLIKSDWAFEWYVRSLEVREKLQAGTYVISPSQTVPEIVDMLVEGRVATDRVTILPGQRIDQVRQAFIKSGFEAAAVDRAFSPGLYARHPALVDKPASATLEGYLYPETFNKTSNTDPEDIVRLSLDEMQTRLTPERRAGFAAQGLSGHQAITLASIIEREVSRPDDRAQVAQIFLRRLVEGIRLESDATASYGAVLAGESPTEGFDSVYNTYTRAGLPPGPISNVTASSLEAVARPANTDWLYFVSGDDGTTYFSHTLEQHEESVRKHCKKCFQ